MNPSHLQDDSDVEQILRIAVADAVRTDDRTLRERLMLAAEELGLSSDQIERAEAKWQRERQMRVELAEYMSEQRKWFWPHLLAYLAVNTVLVILNLSEWDGFPWAVFPLVGWGIGVYAHAQEVFNVKSAEFREEFRKWRDQRRSSDLA